MQKACEFIMFLNGVLTICGKVMQKAFEFMMFLNGSPRLRKGFKIQHFWSRNGARLPQKSEMAPFVFLYNCEDRPPETQKPLENVLFLKETVGFGGFLNILSNFL